MKNLLKYFGVGIVFYMVLVLSNHIVFSTSIETEQPHTTMLMNNFLRDRRASESLPALALTPCIAGMADIYPCNNVDLMAFMPLSSIGGGNGNDVWGWTDPLTGNEYALMGRSSGTAFIDITDPENPVYLGNLPTHTVNSSWRDIKVYNNYAFIVSEAGSHGMQIFDLTQLRSVVSPPVTFSNTAHYSSFGDAHNLVINEDTGFAYALGANVCGRGLHFIDIRDPLNPVGAGCFSADGYTHDAQCVIYNGPDLEHIGKEICFNANEDTVTIVDVTDKSSPIQLSRTGYSGSNYVHQGWLTEDQAYFLQNDELDEYRTGINTRTRIWDVSNLDSPSVIAFYDGSTLAIDHNLYTKGHTVYESNYRAGLQILDARNVSSGSLSEIAYFDIYPADNRASFNGSWSNYPYFDSDIVVVSGIEQGMFILRPNLAGIASDFSMKPDKVVMDVCTGSNDTVYFNLDDIYGYSNSVNLSVTGVPTGTIALLSPNTLVPSGVTTLTVTNTSAAAGNYLLTVVGTDGSLTHQEYLRLNTLEDVQPFTLLSPANSMIDVPIDSILTWNSVLNAGEYFIEVATDSSFTSVVYSMTTKTASITPPTFDYETTYYWRVTARNSCSEVVSSVFQFTTEVDPVCVAPAAPVNVSATYVASDVTLSWIDTGDSQYEVWYMANNPYFVPGDAGSLMEIVTGPFAATVTWTHVNGVGDVANNYFYVVTNSCGDAGSVPIEIQGEFDFMLLPGS